MQSCRDKRGAAPLPISLRGLPTGTRLLFRRMPRVILPTGVPACAAQYPTYCYIMYRAVSADVLLGSNVPAPNPVCPHGTGWKTPANPYLTFSFCILHYRFVFPQLSLSLSLSPFVVCSFVLFSFSFVIALAFFRRILIR